MDVKAGQLVVFDLETLSTSVAVGVGAVSGIQSALSCAQTVSGNSPTASGAQLVHIALGCLAVGAVKGALDWEQQKILERHDDFLIGPQLDAKPVIDETWRQTIESMQPPSPWGRSSP